MTLVVRFGVCAAVILGLAGEVLGQELPVGRLVGSVVSRANPAQRYAVYLPTSFDRTTPMPILFIMDYRGRARVAAEVFRPAAERYGWILMSSSSTASDEAPGPTFEALKAMWTDAHDLFPVDEKRLYLSGLSGTARAATWIATELKGTVAGVIGAAAGFAPLTPPSRETSFAYFGTAGDADYNYWEMRSLERRLTELDVAHRMEYFPGPHGWMPPSVARTAIEWLELRAMKSGACPRDDEFIDDLWWRDLQAAETLEEVGRPTAASRRLAAMARDYEGLRPAEDLAAARARAAMILAQPYLQGAADTEQAAAAAHQKRIADAMLAIARAFPAGTDRPAVPLDTVLDELRVSHLRSVAAGRDQLTALDARRILAELDVQTGFYLPAEAMRAGDDARAGFYLDLARAINPDDPYAWFLRARVSVRTGRPSQAIDGLDRAVKLGFRTLDALEHDHAFDPIRNRAEFTKLVDQVRAAWEAVRVP